MENEIAQAIRELKRQLSFGMVIQAIQMLAITITLFAIVLAIVR